MCLTFLTAWGRFLFFFSRQRFGSGYTLTVRIDDEHHSKLPHLKSFIMRTFRDVHLREEHRNMLHYQLGAANTSLAQVFHHLEMARDRFHVEDYSVSQTTLDQVS